MRFACGVYTCLYAVWDTRPWSYEFILKPKYIDNRESESNIYMRDA